VRCKGRPVPARAGVRHARSVSPRGPELVARREGQYVVPLVEGSAALAHGSGIPPLHGPAMRPADFARNGFVVLDG
jgi:hypothetical protein